MRILIVTDDSDLLTAKRTAARRWAAVAPALAARCGDVEIATLREMGPLHSSVRARGHDAFALRCGSRWKLPLAILRLAIHIRRRRFDVVHADETIPALVGGCAALIARARVRVYFRSHAEGSRLHALVSRLATKVTSLTLCASDAVAQLAREVDGAHHSRIRVVPNGSPPLRAVTEGEVRELKERLRIDAGAFVVAAVARLREEKGIDSLLKAMEGLGPALQRPAHLVIVGSGPEETYLRALAASMTRFEAHFVGHQDDLAPWYAVADVVCVPSRREAFGLVTLEAMATAKPVVASSVGGLVEVVDEGITGVLVSPDDSHALTSALLDLAKSRAKRVQLGNAGRERFSSSFTIDAMAAGWCRCYRDALPHDLSPAR